MATFIIVTRASGLKTRINVDHILTYYPEEWGDHVGADIMSTTKEKPIWVRETAPEIDRLIADTSRTSTTYPSALVRGAAPTYEKLDT